MQLQGPFVVAKLVPPLAHRNVVMIAGGTGINPSKRVSFSLALARWYKSKCTLINVYIYIYMLVKTVVGTSMESRAKEATHSDNPAPQKAVVLVDRRFACR